MEQQVTLSFFGTILFIVAPVILIALSATIYFAACAASKVSRSKNVSNDG